MVFDKNQPEEGREKYQGVTPEISKLGRVAETVQTDYIKGDSGIIGGLTTIEGVQSTKTRRPISASIDIVVNGADIDKLGQNYDSWKWGGAYFADVEDIEVGILEMEEFEPYEFPNKTIKEGFYSQIKDNEIKVAHPDANVASKFNRIKSGEVTKKSDIIDMNSHLHWYAETERSIKSLAQTIEDTIERTYPSVEEFKLSGKNFTDEESAMLVEAQRELKELLER